MMHSRVFQLRWLALLCAFFSMKQYAAAQGNVGVRLDYLPGVVHPYTYLDPNAEEVLRLVYQPLMATDPVTMKPVPVLAVSVPRPEVDSLGRTLLTFQLRPEAVWDNGRYVVARDVAFSLKVFKCPLVSVGERRDYLASLRDIELYLDDPRKFTLVFDKPSYEVIDALQDLYVLDAFEYDPLGYLNAYDLAEMDSLLRSGETRKLDRGLFRFATAFNGRNYAFEKLLGSGPYAFVPPGDGEELRLKRKDPWWGDALEGINPYFTAVPDVVRFVVEEDETEALRRTANGDMDVLGGLSPQLFESLRNDRAGNNKYYFLEMPVLAFEYMGFNMEKPYLKDVRVRQAIACLIDYDQVIRLGKQGLAERTVGPVPPSFTDLYAYDLPLFGFNSALARIKLAEAGWIDHDKDGLVDNIVNGRRMALRLNLVYNHEQPQRKVLGDLLKAAAAKVGVDVTVQGYDYEYYARALQDHGFDLFVGGWFNGPTLTDPGVLFGSWARPEQSGHNYTGYTSAVADSLIGRIRQGFDREALAFAVKDFQRQLQQDMPCVFLYMPRQQLLVSRRFKKPSATALRPGYWVQGMMLEE